MPSQTETALHAQARPESRTGSHLSTHRASLEDTIALTLTINGTQHCRDKTKSYSRKKSGARSHLSTLDPDRRISEPG